MHSPETAAAPRNYTAVAKAYARAALAKKNRRRFGIWIRFAARRFLEDLERARKRDAPFYFDEWHAFDVCDFIEKLPHVEGRWALPTIELDESHVFFLAQLFGFRKQDGTRRFTTALFAVGRKNAKSTLAAAIGLYCETCEDEVGPQVVSAATTGGQARVVFNVAHKMVKATTDLRTAFDLEPFANSIACYANGGSFKPINAKAKSQDGLNPSCTIIDELHAHQTPDLMSVLRSAAGARSNPLFLYTTTEGYANAGPWEEEREFAKKVLRGIVTDADHYLACYYALDEANDELETTEDDEFDESTWEKANPLIRSNPLLLPELRKLAIEAREKPGAHSEFKIKRCNRPASVARGWINLTKWRACRAEVDLEQLRPLPCYGGLDLSSTIDFCAFRLVWPMPGGWLATIGWRWVPSVQVRKRKDRGLVPYAAWVQSGRLIESGDEAIDYAPIEAKVIECSEQFNLKRVNYDAWNARQSVQRLKAANVPVEEFIQGPKSYHPAMQALEICYLGGKLAHGNDPVLNWNASNIVARKDVNLNMAPDKRKSSEKIDDLCALLMGVGGTIADVEPEPEFQVMVF